VRFSLTPKDVSFFDLLAAQARHLVDGADVLEQMIAADFDERVDLAVQLREIEHTADVSTHTIIKKLNSSFVTPFDRDDIYDLASALDDCMDHMEEAADLIVLYRIDALPKKIGKQITILRRAAAETAEAMPRLRSLDGLSEYWVEINRLENQADRAYRAMLADLFQSETDAILVMKLKELIEALENAADSFERVANTVETIALKES
jgi:predicted phosphate transport protein (TIGR00153 family)